jgi:bacteriocin-like protein
MSEQNASPQPETTAMAPSSGAETDGAELSDEELEHVVGGLARTWLVPEERPSNNEGSGVAGAHVVLSV